MTRRKSYCLISNPSLLFLLTAHTCLCWALVSAPLFSVGTRLIPVSTRWLRGKVEFLPGGLGARQTFWIGVWIGWERQATGLMEFFWKSFPVFSSNLETISLRNHLLEETITFHNKHFFLTLLDFILVASCSTTQLNSSADNLIHLFWRTFQVF